MFTLTFKLASSSALSSLPKSWWTCVRCLHEPRVKRHGAGTESAERSPHLYKCLYPWKSTAEFVEHLAENVLFNQDGLVALSKPYGVPLTMDFLKRGRALPKPRVHVSGTGESPYSLEGVLDQLSKRLGHTSLFCIKSAERYASGVTLLAANEKAASRARKALLRAKPMLLPNVTAWIITKGYPTQPMVKERVGMKFVNIDSDEKQVEIVRDFGKVALKERRVKPATVECHILSTNTSLAVSLLQISTTCTQWNFLRAYVASKVSCVLGDLSQAVRVASVLGRPLLLSPAATTSAQPQSLPDEVCQRLSIPLGLTGHRQVPAMVHYRSLLLPMYNQDGSHLLLESSHLPAHFTWTLERLGLEPQSTI